MKRALAVAAGLAAISLPAGAGATDGVGSRQRASVAGTWRVYSSRIDYDRGGAGVTQPLSSRVLKLKGHTWRFGSSKGRTSVARITAADWKRWDISPYGPTSKIVLRGWSRTTATGPIEESGGRVDFIWVIYHAAPPTVREPGTIHTKFGRVRP